MTEFTITSGTATYTRVRQPAPYESQTPGISLNFEVAPGADPEKVIATVLRIARNAAEGVLSTPQDTSSRTRKPKEGAVPEATPSPIVDAPVQEPDVADGLTALAGESKPPVTPEDDLAALAGGDPEPEHPAYTSKDVETALQKASSHLREQFGHINDIRKLIASFGIAGYASLKPEQYADFIGKTKAMLSMKKDG